MAEDEKTPDETPEEQQQPAAEETPAEQPTDEAPEVVVEGEVGIDEDVEDLEEDEEEPTPRVKPAIPGADLEVDIVREDEVHRGESRWSVKRGKCCSSARPLIVYTPLPGLRITRATAVLRLPVAV